MITKGKINALIFLSNSLNVFCKEIMKIGVENLYVDILGLQPHDKVAMLGVNTIEILLEKFT